MAQTIMINDTQLEAILESIQTHLTARIANMVTTGMITTTLNTSSTNTQIPGALATYNRINELITSALSGLSTMSVQVVTTLPATGEAMVIYLVPVMDGATPTGFYTQHMWVDNAWREIGSTQIDIDGYWNDGTHRIITAAERTAMLQRTGFVV